MLLTQYIDHTLLKPICTIDEIRLLCTEAIQHQFKAVCIPPYYVNEAAKIFEKAEYKPAIATVIGFPLGYSTTAAKVQEIRRAVDDGANEVDAVINLCALKSRNWNYLESDIESMIMAAHMSGKRIKVILETSLLTDTELKRVCDMLLKHKPDFAKTSTGYEKGATVAEVEQLIKLLDGKIAVKASGGIRNKKDAEALIKAGAKRLGTSAGLDLV
jgi:deoxyribose-phosphate aldolase